MATNQPSKKPRVRKSAPTLREQAELTRSEADKKGKGRIKRAVRPLRRVRLPRNRGTQPIWTIGRFLRRLLPSYFVNSWREVRQVAWPGRKETWRLTAAVFVFAIVFGAAVYTVDKGLDELFKRLILS